MAKTSIYLSDELAQQAREHGIPISEVAQAAVRREVDERTRLRELQASGMKRIIVMDGKVKKAFTGRWIAGDEIQDYWNVAVTKGGRLVLAWEHPDPRVDAEMTIYESFQDMESHGVSGEILSEVAAALGRDEYVVELDI